MDRPSLICECGHDAVEHDPPPADATPDAYGACAACDECEEFRGTVDPEA